VEAISAVTNETATGTSQIARAAEDLNRLTENLTQIVGRFKLANMEHQTSNQGYEQSHFAVRSNGKLVAHEVA
jgi:hypothetical protein